MGVINLVYNGIIAVLKCKMRLVGAFCLLSDQGSNLNSSEPKSDVLPITPSDNPPLWGCKDKKYFNYQNGKINSCADSARLRQEDLLISVNGRGNSG